MEKRLNLGVSLEHLQYVLTRLQEIETTEKDSKRLFAHAGAISIVTALIKKAKKGSFEEEYNLSLSNLKKKLE